MTTALPRLSALALAGLLIATGALNGPRAFAEETSEPVATASPTPSEPKADPAPEAKPDPAPEAKPEPEPDPKAEPTPAPEATAEPQPTPKTSQSPASTAEASTSTPAQPEPAPSRTAPAHETTPIRLARAATLSAPNWPHLTLSHPAGATAWVESEVATGSAGTLRLRGSGWLSADGSRASTVAVKLNRGATAQYSRSGNEVITHPSATGDTTIWALLAPSNPTGHAHVLPVSADGTFDVSLDLPANLVQGQYLSLTLQSGRFDSGDVQRTLTSDYLSVGGQAWTPGTGGGPTQCTPSTPSPELEVAATATIGGTLRVTGTGWCHPTNGGSVVAIKLDEGGYSRLTDAVHQNRTIWTLVEAEAASGDWSIDLDLPDGTTATSLPAFLQGSHSLRLLTGSLKPGDIVRTMLSSSFTVGEYQPLTTPDPIDPSTDLSPTTGILNVVQSATQLVVTVPGARAGDWLYLNLYDGEVPRFPWPAWLRADASGSVTVSLSGVVLPSGTPVLTVQSGNADNFGALRGWAGLRGSTTVPSTPTPVPTPTTTTAQPSPTAVPRTVTRLTRTLATASAPASIPAAPVTRSALLATTDSRGVTLTLSGSRATLSVPKGTALHWVYLYGYTGARVSPIGWAQLSSSRQVVIDIAALGKGHHRLAVLAAGGSSLGWAEAAVGIPAPAAMPSQSSTAPTTSPVSAPPVATVPAPTPVQVTTAGTLDVAAYAVAGLIVVLGGIGGFRIGRRPHAEVAA